MPRARRSLAGIRAQRERDREAAVALRKAGKSAGETAEILGLSSARAVRKLCSGVAGRSFSVGDRHTDRATA